MPLEQSVRLYNKQNNTWTLGDMEFIFLWLHSILNEWAQRTSEISTWTLEDKFQISAHACIILYIFWMLIKVTWTSQQKSQIIIETSINQRMNKSSDVQTGRTNFLTNKSDICQSGKMIFPSRRTSQRLYNINSHQTVKCQTICLSRRFVRPLVWQRSMSWPAKPLCLHTNSPYWTLHFFQCLFREFGQLSSLHLT